MVICVWWNQIYKKNGTVQVKKIQTRILQQSNIFRSGYIDSQPMSALPYFMQVTIILLC